MNLIKIILKSIIKKRNTNTSILGDCCCIDHSSKIINSQLEGANTVSLNCEIINSRIGFATYLAGHDMLANAKVGRYCSIASGVQIIRGRHPTDKWVSTHPSFFSTRMQSGVCYVSETKYEELRFASEQYSVLVGNDVWIGANALILDGVSIGDGSIVGAGSVVTRDVPPFAIVGGVPAKVIKYRFSEEEILWLLELKWWDKDENWIKSHAVYFDNIKKFRECVNEEEIKE